jgi:hypothetical protein
MIIQKVPTSVLITNVIIEVINDFDAAKVVAAAKAYKAQ